MLISGLQKMTLLDYPGQVACTVFTGGCNFRCPFCHNAQLVLPKRMDDGNMEEEVLRFLKKRSGLLDGVAITGGEPLLHEDMADFLRRVRNLAGHQRILPGAAALAGRGGTGGSRGDGHQKRPAALRQNRGRAPF